MAEDSLMKILKNSSSSERGALVGISKGQLNFVGGEKRLFEESGCRLSEDGTPTVKEGYSIFPYSETKTQNYNLRGK